MDRRRLSPLRIGCGALVLMLACSNQNGGTEGSGTGGESSTGGSGGDDGSGGRGTGGSSMGTGGSVTGTGGSRIGTGGTATGGAQGTAGAGGTNATGGTTGTGGGIPFKGVANSPCAVRKKLSVSWYYNWGQTVDGSDPCDSTGGQFVPMVWGHTGNEQSASGISSAVSSFVSKGYGHVLGFNEPDNSGQANLPVATAVSLWPSFNNSAIQVGTPATSANAAGQTWFTSFMGSLNASTTLHAEFIAIHWYGWNAGSCDAAASQL